ncbi:MAG: PorP/SprF family type IX secretion system membrane protein [Saprospiraceae bacterium]
MKIIYTIIFCFFLTQGFSQDPSFSQFYANRIYLNPAFTGLESGVSVAGVSRMQWTSVDDGYRTYGFSAEIQEPYINSGIGIHLMHNSQGLAQLNATSVGLSYSYMIPMKKHNIHIGMEGSWNQRSIDWDKVVFSDQLDAVNGNVYSSSYIPLMDRTTFTDFNMGVVWRFNTDLKLKKRRLRDLHHSIGISMNHLPALFGSNSGSESFQNLDTKILPRMTIHGGSMIPLTYFKGKKNNLTLSPNFKVDIQGDGLFHFKENLQVFTYGAYVLYQGYYFGALYQNKNVLSRHQNTNAWIIACGAYINTDKGQRFFLGFSYDANTTGVGTAAGGVYEIAFRWTGNGNVSIFGGNGKNGKGGRSGRGGRKKKRLDCYHFF